MPTTLNVADKPTLNSVKTDTDTLITRGGIRHNGTNPQVYDTTNDTWVDLPSGGSLSPTIIIKNHFYEDGDMDNLDITVTQPDTGWTTTQNMGTGDSITIEVPWCDKYEIDIIWDNYSLYSYVDVIGVGGVLCDNDFTIKPVSFSTGTDAQIKTMLDAYYDDLITWSEMGWAIGDTRTISLASMTAPSPNSSNTWAAQNITVVIVDHDHTDLATPINGHTKACITVQTREVLNNNTAAYNEAGHIYINGDSSTDSKFTKWSDLYMRTYLNSTVWGAFPSTFKSAIKSSSHYRHTTYDGTASEEVTDNLFLPSYPEIFGTVSYSYYTATNPVEGTQFSYYATSSNRIKYGNNNGASNGTSQWWWNGSPSKQYDSYSSYKYLWCDVYTNGNNNTAGGSYAAGLAPAFAM